MGTLRGPVDAETQIGPQTRSFWFAFARYADGVTLEQARAEMQEIGRRLERAHPVANRGIVPSVKNFREAWLGPNAGTFYSSRWAAVAFVLLIACANLANLLVARAIGRSRGIAARVTPGSLTLLIALLATV